MARFTNHPVGFTGDSMLRSARTYTMPQSRQVQSDRLVLLRIVGELVGVWLFDNTNLGLLSRARQRSLQVCTHERALLARQPAKAIIGQVRDVSDRKPVCVALHPKELVHLAGRRTSS